MSNIANRFNGKSCIYIWIVNVVLAFLIATIELIKIYFKSLSRSKSLCRSSSSYDATEALCHSKTHSAMHEFLSVPNEWQNLYIEHWLLWDGILVQCCMQCSQYNEQKWSGSMISILVKIHGRGWIDGTSVTGSGWYAIWDNVWGVAELPHN